MAEEYGGDRTLVDRTDGAPDRNGSPRTAPQVRKPPAGGATAGGGTNARGGTKLSDRVPKAPDNVREFFSRRPTVGPGTAAQAVVTDISDLVKAEVALAKAEFTQKATEKGMGVGLFTGAAIAGWLGLQGLLIAIGFVLALWLPGWAAALIVTAVLFLIAGILALIGKKKFSTPLALETTKGNVSEDVAWTKAHLNGPAKP